MRPTLARGILSAGAVLLAAGSLATADYFGLLGVTQQIEQDFTHMNFRFFDEQSNEPIEGVRLVCTRTGTNSACTQKTGFKRGAVQATLAVARLTKKTHWFSHKIALRISDNGRLSILFVHPGYKPRSKIMDANAVEMAGTDEIIVHLRRAAETD